MQVAELRERLLGKLGEVASVGDRETIATTLEYARAVLITLAQYPEDYEVALQNASVDTRTAALILRLHPEHVRYLIRQERLPASKENGEYSIGLSTIADFMVSEKSLPSTLAPRTIMSLEESGFTLWQQSQERSGPTE